MGRLAGLALRGSIRCDDSTLQIGVTAARLAAQLDRLALLVSQLPEDCKSRTRPDAGLLGHHRPTAGEESQTEIGIGVGTEVTTIADVILRALA